MKFFSKLKNKKGLTGADVAAAITLIVLTVGIVTSIYVNTINKSKDNIRFANATRIATNVIENIQKQPYEYLTGICKNGTNSDTYEVSGGNTKVFDTKIPNGFKLKVTAKKVAGTGTNFDVARDVFVNVSYRASTTYKTITLTTMKEKEVMDMTNKPDISLISGYNPSATTTYYYPVIKDGSNYKVTTTSDVNWYDYERGYYAIIYKTTTSKNVGENATGGTPYVWIPRFAAKTSGTGTSSVQFLYGTSDYKITLKDYGNLKAYGVSYSGTIEASSLPSIYDSGYSLNNSSSSLFVSGDGLSGVWYQIGGANTNIMGTNDNTVQTIAQKLNARIPCKNVTIN